MKKNVWIMMLVILLGGASVVHAEGMKGGMMNEGMMDKGMMGHEMMSGKMMGMHEMMKPTVVATSDGGVVVISGDTMTKYDKNLNLVKEVELKKCMECMHGEKSEMKKGCPMMGKGMMGKMDKDDDDDDDAAVKPAGSVDHAIHH